LRVCAPAPVGDQWDEEVFGPDDRIDQIAQQCVQLGKHLVQGLVAVGRQVGRLVAVGEGHQPADRGKHLSIHGFRMLGSKASYTL
jgi:hypothetical protein